jgi:hypothetical protein
VGSLVRDVFERLKTALAGRYSVERELGSGGMAVVYLAEDLRLERRVAIKVLRPELASLVAAERFLCEIKLTASLAHPHILRGPGLCSPIRGSCLGSLMSCCGTARRAKL